MRVKADNPLELSNGTPVTLLETGDHRCDGQGNYLRVKLPSGDEREYWEWSGREIGGFNHGPRRPILRNRRTA